MASEQEILAAGGVVWSGRHPDVKVAVIHRPKHDDWSLPKGKLHQGESAVAAALREVWEETAVRPTLGPRLGTVHYPVRGRPKSVEYWGLRGDEMPFEANAEVDRVAWLPVDEARRRVTYPHDAELLERFELIASPLDSVVLLVTEAATEAGTGAAADEQLRRAVQLFAPTRVVTATVAGTEKSSIWALFFSQGKLLASDHYADATRLSPPDSRAKL